MVISLIDTFTHSLNPWCRVLFEKLTGLQLVKKFPHFTEPEGSLPHSQASATCLYPGPAQSSPYTHIPPPGEQTLPPGDLNGGVVYLQIVLSPEQASRMWVFLNKVFYREGLLAPRPTPKLSATAYSIYSQLPSLWEAIPLSAIWGRAMLWWRGRTTWAYRYIVAWKVVVIILEEYIFYIFIFVLKMAAICSSKFLAPTFNITQFHNPEHRTTMKTAYLPYGTCLL